MFETGKTSNHREKENAELLLRRVVIVTLEYILTHLPRKGCTSVSYNDLTRKKRVKEALRDIRTKNVYAPAIRIITEYLEYVLGQSVLTPLTSAQKDQNLRIVAFLGTLTNVLRIKTLKEMIKHPAFGESFQMFSKGGLENTLFTLLHLKQQWEIATLQADLQVADKLLIRVESTLTELTGNSEFSLCPNAQNWYQTVDCLCQQMKTSLL